jgi:hypothetical protein
LGDIKMGEVGLCEETSRACLLRDRDAIYGQGFAGMMKGMGMEEVMSAPRSPWGCTRDV